jgi:hypothetical protein
MNEAEVRSRLEDLRFRHSRSREPAERAKLAEEIESLVEQLPEASRTASGGGTAHVTGGSHLRREHPPYSTRMMVPEVDS